ncbi:MAG: hypothetical protein KAJ76_10095 [Candidatus Heimdallarchaeota archaeon]|nr:hypothetical protein [Candidatus Heimdallarchaeota archaeon]MCK5299247.1 hypothetical protein [Candidatus Heimdallarchaeota archaeon]
MSDRLGFGWQFIGVILCGFVFAIPIAIAYFIAKAIQGRVQKIKEKDVEDQIVI